MNKYILGSGLTGLVAKHVLGDEWKLIPFGRSRFYSTRPVIGDDFVIKSNEMDTLLPSLELPIYTKRFVRAFSMAGQLIFSEQSFAKKAYINKIFGNDQHPAVEMLTKTELTVYKTSATQLYSTLLAKYLNDIRSASDMHGKVVAISDHHIKTEKSDIEFDRVVSTIPFDALLRYMGKNVELPARDVWYYHIKSPTTNLEGAREALVVDAFIDFHKSTYLGQQEYLFHSLGEIKTPLQYFNAFLGSRMELLNQTSISRAIPIGQPPNLTFLEDADVHPVGDHGQWDCFMDISSSLNKIRRISNLSDR